MDIFGQIRTLIKTSAVYVDNNVFKLHYRLTVIILVGCTLVIGSRKYFGDPIDCTSFHANYERIVDNFCWFNSYIIVPKDPEYGYDGLGSKLGANGYRPVIGKYELKDLAYTHPDYKPYFLHAYQWIEFILLLQAVLFFTPRYLWRYCWEQGRVKALTESCNLVLVKQDDNNKQTVIDIVRFLKQNKFDHYEYAWKFVVCEVLNFINVVAQFCLVGSTMGVSWDVLVHDFFTSNSNTNPESPLNLIFPNVARCDIPATAAASPHIQTEICVLPVNVFTTKIYIFLWFHFCVLSVISGINIIYRAATIISPQFRCFLLKRSGQTLTEDCTRAIRSIGYGEWFLIDLVGQNMNAHMFKTLIKEYNDDLVASRPSFSLIGNDKIYNADLGALSNLNKESEK